MILRHTALYAWLVFVGLAVVAGKSKSTPGDTKVSASAEDTMTTMELHANSGARLKLKERLAPADAFSGSYSFLSEQATPVIFLLTVTDAESNHLIARCQFNNRPLNSVLFYDVKNNSNNSNIEPRWLTFEWQIEGRLLRCHTPESETFFKLDDGAPSTAYTVEIPSSNATLCLHDLRTSDSPSPMRCPSVALNGLPVDNADIHCGCSRLDSSADASVEFPLANNLLAFGAQNTPLSQEAGNGVGLVPLPSPVAFPMFRPSLTPQVGRASSAVQPSIMPSASKDYNAAPIFDHLKVSPLPSSTTSASTISLPSEISTHTEEFTPAPEIRIRGTRPPFHHDRSGMARRASLAASPVTTETPSAPTIVDISDIHATEMKAALTPEDGTAASADFAVEAVPPAVANVGPPSVLPICTPKCEMGGTCVSASDGSGSNICKCPDGLLGRNCNIFNPCANSSTCSEHYGPSAQCIVDVETMAKKAPPLLVEAPHLCYCRDDNSDWKSCDDLFKMEFGGSVPITGALVTTPPTPMARTTVSTSATTPPIVDELGAFSVRESLRIASATNATDGISSDGSSASASSDEVIPRPTFPLHYNITKPTVHTGVSSSSSSRSSADVKSAPNSSESNSNTSPIFTQLTGLESTNAARPTETTVESSAPTTVIHLSTPTTTVKKATTTQATTTRINTSPKAPIAVALPIPGAGNETDLPIRSTTTQMAQTTAAEFTTTAPTEAEGDNGFERITQHIHESHAGTDGIPEANPNEEEFDKISPPMGGSGTGRHSPHEEHGGVFDNNLVTPDFMLPEAETEDDGANIFPVTRVTPRVTVAQDNNRGDKNLITNTDDHEYVNVTPLYGSAAGSRDSAHRSAFQSSAASWIIGVGVLGLVLVTLATGGACVGRYIRRSRRLHGKYNPSREESALATAYAMPMTSVGKEERLI